MHSAGQLPEQTIWLCNLPVNFEIAPLRVINAIYRYRPRAIVCCGMAENRALLSWERQARGASKVLRTCLDLEYLIADAPLSEISDDAGQYVCNALYYRVLEVTLRDAIATSLCAGLEIPCVFVHVPMLSEKTRSLIQMDMFSVLNKLCR